jgi:hypothetical protein
MICSVSLAYFNSVFTDLPHVIQGACEYESKSQYQGADTTVTQGHSSFSLSSDVALYVHIVNFLFIFDLTHNQDIAMAWIACCRRSDPAKLTDQSKTISQTHVVDNNASMA